MDSSGLKMTMSLPNSSEANRHQSFVKLAFYLKGYLFQPLVRKEDANFTPTVNVPGSRKKEAVENKFSIYDSGR